MLLVRAGALGDVLLLRPVVAALKAAGARVALLAPEHSGRALLGPGPSEVDRLIDWDRPDVAWLMGPDAGMPARLRRELEGVDLAVAYTRNEVLARNLGQVVPSVIAWDPTPTTRGLHASEYLAEPLVRLGLGVEADPPACVPTEAERAAAAILEGQLPRGFAALHPGSGAPAKNWPAASFAMLVERLAGTRRWLLVEGPADEDAAADLGRLPGAVAATHLPLRVLGALLSRSGIFVGNDSGVTHLAAAFGAPAVALYGPTDPATWRPLGRNVQALRSPTGRMSGLNVEDVEGGCLALQRRLTSAEAGPRGC